MTPRLFQLYAVRAQVDALIAAEEAEIGARPVVSSADMCPHCGASGEGTQQDTSTLDGTKKRTCTVCKRERPL